MNHVDSLAVIGYPHDILMYMAFFPAKYFSICEKAVKLNHPLQYEINDYFVQTGMMSFDMILTLDQ